MVHPETTQYVGAAPITTSLTYTGSDRDVLTATTIKDKGSLTLAVPNQTTGTATLQLSVTNTGLAGAYTGSEKATTTWGITNAGDTGATINKDTGELSITNEGKAGTVTVQASTAVAGGEPKTDTADVTITKAPSEVQSISVSGNASSLEIPADSTAATATFTATVKDQYGEGSADGVVWSIAPTVAGVSIDNTGKVTVTNAAKNGISASQNFTVTASLGGKDGSATLTVARAESEITSVVISGGKDSITVPSANDTVTTETADFDATVLDQYGAEMTSESVTWSTDPSNEKITISTDGVLSIGEFAVSSNTNVVVTATATNKDTVKGTATVQLVLDRSARNVEIVDQENQANGTTDPDGYTIVIPAAGQTTLDLFARADDKYGFEIPGTYTAEWETTLPSSMYKADGNKITITVPADATADQTYTLTATVNGVVETTQIKVIDKILLTVDITGLSVTGAGKPYDGTAVSRNGEAFAKLNGETKPVTINYTWEKDGVTLENAPKDAGSYKLVATVDDATYAGSASIEFTIEKKPVAVLYITIKEKTYDGTTNATVTGMAFDLSNGKNPVGTDDAEIVLSGIKAKFKTADAGTNKPVEIISGLVLTGADAGNYTLEEFTKTPTATINPADYTPSNTEDQNVVVGIGTFTEPTFPGVNGETVTGTLSYTYNNTPNMTYDAVVAELAKLPKEATATIEWSFTANNGNYVNTEKTGTINVTMVDIIFQVGSETAAADNAVTVAENPVYGDDWADIVQIKENAIEASVNGELVDGTYTLNVTGVPDAGENQPFKVLFTSTDGRYENVEVLSGTVTVAKRTAVLEWDGYENLTYNGQPKSVTATVSNLVSGDTCTATVTGGGETNAGTYTATATGLSDGDNYQLPTNDTVQQEYTIAPKKTTFTVELSKNSFEYNEQVQKPNVTVKDGTTELTVDVDYTVSIPTSKDVGTYTVTVEGKGNYAGSTGTATYEITKQHQDALEINVPAGTKTYGDDAFEITVTGGSGTGAVTLTSSDSSILKLEQGEGKWTATILKAGTVTLTANKAGDNNYEPATEVEVEVTIAQKSLTANDIEVTLEKDSFEYTGSAFTPAVTVMDGETELKPDTDYTVTYTNNTNAGTDATVTVTGKDNYTGTVEKKFTITAKDFSESAVISGLPAEITYTGSPIEPVVTVKVGETVLTKGTDYTVGYSANTDVGTVTVTVSGRGNYVGSKEASFKIVAAAASGVVTIAGTDYQVGTELTAEVSGKTDDLTYQWYRGGAAIEGATAAKYTLTADDAGKEISVKVTSAGNYVGDLESAAITVGKAPLTGTVTLSESEGKITAAVEGAVDGSYDIVWLRDGQPISGATGTEYTVTDDDKGHTISAKLVAKGDTYTGEIVAASGVAVAAEKPNAPVVTASAGNGQITVSWTAQDNGSPITQYQVQLNSEAVITLDAATASYTFTGLTNGTEYTVTVKAINAIGTSEAGSASATPKAPSGGGGGGVSTPTYTSTVESTTNGTVTVSPKNASKDATVTITVTPNEGYALDTLTVTDKDGKTVELTKVSDTKYTFKMPGSAVTVKAAFAEQPDGSKLPFTDVAESAWYYDAVAYVYENGMMTGTNDGTTFSPAMNLTRGMMAQVLYNIEKGTAGTAGTFTDVAADAWYADAVNWAAAKGIVNGYGNGKFGPEDSITREQMAVLLYNYAKFKGYDMSAAADLTSFSDDEQVSDWAEYAMQWAVAEKLIQGSNNALNPLGTASRAEVAQILTNFGQNVTK